MKVVFNLRFRTQMGQKLSVCIQFAADPSDMVLPLLYLNQDFWQASLEVDTTANAAIRYRYIFTNEGGEEIQEAEKARVVQWTKHQQTDVIAIDSWNDAGAYENVFYTAPFDAVFLPKRMSQKTKKRAPFTHLFKAKAPLLHEDESLCLVGEGVALGEWNTATPLRMTPEEDWWVLPADLSGETFPVTYKYGVYNTKKAAFIRFEEGANRSLTDTITPDAYTLVHDGFARLPNTTWKGSGIAIPVFSLKSERSFGIGEFTDLKLLADWAVQTGIKLIQILPINDTTATATWRDSYPYAAISAFALHPIYINLGKVAGKGFAKTVQLLSKKGRALNSLPFVDYEKVLQFKMAALRELYDLQAGAFLQDREYKEFFEANRHWLIPYAAFCYLRDKYGTADHTQWKTYSNYNHFEVEKLVSNKNKSYKKIAFHYFVQYHLHLQLKEAADYAHKKGIVLKGDIAIGVFRNGCDTWTAPDLYNMDKQAGAPPDDFAVKGQNWGFPTYNWHRMQENEFEWWRKRFLQMSYYFDAFRIDHILGFFRIWSIPEHAVEGILGVFVPALPIGINEFQYRGISFDPERFCMPYITDAVLQHYFGDAAEMVKETFLNPHASGRYELKQAFNTQKKVASYFADQDGDEAKKLKEGLFDLISNVILFEDGQSGPAAFHFRISVEATLSFQHLDDDTKQKLYALYIDYFYHRQDGFWKREALRKLPALKESTHMLICGEDLGMVPHSVPEVMKRLGILSLEIQRMPKDPRIEFFHPKDAPYLSVITPSTHDMSTVRGWWEEDRTRTQHFYNTILQQHGTAPYFCEAWVNRAIVLQHLYAPAMWAIFQLQDLLGMSETLRRENPHDERINIPADPHHYWRYRMHLTLEQLGKETAFNEELRDYIRNSGR